MDRSSSSSAWLCGLIESSDSISCSERRAAEERSALRWPAMARRVVMPTIKVPTTMAATAATAACWVRWSVGGIIVRVWKKIGRVEMHRFTAEHAEHAENSWPFLLCALGGLGG